jgi:ubiquinone/menaquinone biosynthesis C-methylase UbiE
LLASGRATVADVCAELVRSAEFATRLHQADGAGRDRCEAPPAGLIDVRELAQTASVEELNRTAEQYFAAIEDREGELAKPFNDAEMAPVLLTRVSQLIAGLDLTPSLEVLDFGAGTCWLSHILTQMGCRVTALDVSASALELGAELYRRHPPFGDRPQPSFLRFDGHRIELPDASQDRIVCFDALHHVPNPSAVLKEMGRVLRDGGIAGFAEPGPKHSHYELSQVEMQRFGVVENDIVMPEIAQWSIDAGFEDLRMVVFSMPMYHQSLQRFEGFLTDDTVAADFTDFVRSQQLADMRTFFLRKGPEVRHDSRWRPGLVAEIALEEARVEGRTDGSLVLTGLCRVRNSGANDWLVAPSPTGAVSLGIVRVVRCEEGERLVDYDRAPISRAVAPGESALLPLDIRLPPGEEVTLELDMESKGVCWFSQVGSASVRVRISPPTAPGDRASVAVEGGRGFHLGVLR